MRVTLNKYGNAMYPVRKGLIYLILEISYLKYLVSDNVKEKHESISPQRDRGQTSSSLQNYHRFGGSVLRMRSY